MPVNTAFLQTARKAVAITTTGATFSPKVALAPGSAATVTWTCPGVASATGLNPTLSFGSSATRVVYMTVADASGYDAIDQVQLFNLGFDHTNDIGISSLSSSYDYAVQAYSGIFGVNNMRGLLYFLAANQPAFVGTVDFSGMGQLQHIEIFGSQVQVVDIAGCNSLVRCCVEENQLTSLNINPGMPALLDFRGAFQGQAISPVTLTPLAVRAVNLWHYCVRDQQVINRADTSLLPALQQLWIWNTRQSGQLKTWSPAIASVKAFGNQFTSADFTGGFTAALGPDGNTPDLTLDANNLTSLILPSSSTLKTISLADNAFTQAQVDAILVTVAGWGTSSGTLNLAGNPAPSSTGAAAATTLTGRGWTVTTGPGSISVVQTSNSGGTFASNVTVGNTIVAAFAGFSNTSGAMTSSAPTYGGVAAPGAFAAFNPGASNGVNSGLSGGNAAFICCWVIPAVAAAHNNVGITLGGGANPSSIVAYEVAGLGATPVLGPRASGSALTGTVVDAGFMGADSAAKCFCVAAAQLYGGATGSPPPAPWVTTNPSGATWAGYRFGSNAAGNENFAWLQTNANTIMPWAAGIAMIEV